MARKTSKKVMGNNKKSGSSQKKKFSIVYLFPIIMLFSVIPLIISEYVVDTGLGKYNWYQGAVQTMDLFIKGKVVWIYFMMAIMICLAFYMIFCEEIPVVKSKMLIPLGVYMGLAFISACTSIKTSFSFGGGYEQYESIWILLGYGLMVYYSCYIFSREGALERMKIPMLIGIVVMIGFGFLQFIGCNPIQWIWLQKIFLKNKINIGNLIFNFPEGRAYMSLYNPNYVGSYGVLVVPLLTALLLNAKKVYQKIAYLVLIFGTMVVIFASQSRAGIAVSVVCLIIMAFFMRKYWLKNWYVLVGLIALLAGGFIIVNIATDNVLLQRVSTMFSSESKEQGLTNITTGKDVTIYYETNELHMVKEVDNVLLTDQDGKTVKASISKDKPGAYIIEDERFPFSFSLIEQDYFKGFKLTTPYIDSEGLSTTKDWFFTNELIEGDDSYYCRGAGLALIKLKKYKRGNSYLEKHPEIANNRGYIWSKSIDILKKYPILGAGPDTFVLSFDNKDWVGAYMGHHDLEIVTKPHCLYLQIAAQTGIPSLIAFLVFFGWYIISSIRLYWKGDFSSLSEKIGVAAMVAVLGYLVMGLTNDSCVTVAPIFYVVAGLGLGINHRVKNEKA